MKKYLILLAISLFCAVLAGVMGFSTEDKSLEDIYTILLFVGIFFVFFSLYKIGDAMGSSSSKRKSKKKKKKSTSNDDYDDDDDDNDNSSDSSSDSGGGDGGDGD